MFVRCRQAMRGRRPVTGMPDVESAQQWVRDWQSEILDKATQPRELTARVQGLRASAESWDGVVRVVVEATGVPVEITLGDAVSRWAPERIGTEILAVM